MTEIKSWLQEHQDLAYREFQSCLIPNLEAESIIGVRTPLLRDYAKRLEKTGRAGEILNTLPHRYFEENQLHAFLISEEKNPERILAQLEVFLPYVDNWATCDQLRPKALKKYTKELLPYVNKWIQSDQTYTIRFGLGMLNSYYLEEAFDPVYLEWAARIESEEYYVNIMNAWYFATALAKQYEAALPFIEEKRLSLWVHNKAIQKARESRRVVQEHKDYLNTLKIRKKD